MSALVKKTLVLWTLPTTSRKARTYANTTTADSYGRREPSWCKERVLIEALRGSRPKVNRMLPTKDTICHTKKDSPAHLRVNDARMQCVRVNWNAALRAAARKLLCEQDVGELALRVRLPTAVLCREEGTSISGRCLSLSRLFYVVCSQVAKAYHQIQV